MNELVDESFAVVWVLLYHLLAAAVWGAWD